MSPLEGHRSIPSTNAKELDICVTVNWYPPAFSVSLDSEEGEGRVQWRGLEYQYVRVVGWGSKNVILVNTATYSAKYLSLPSHAPALHSLLPTTNQMLHRNCPADTLLQEVIMVRHLLHRVPVSLYHKSLTGTHSFSNYRHIPHYSTFILCTYIVTLTNGIV